MRAVIALCLLYVGVQAMDNGLGLTPPLGWNTWKTCGDADCTHDYCDEHEVKTAAQAMAVRGGGLGVLLSIRLTPSLAQDNGMQALGYVYVNLDDCWAYSRDNVTNQLTWDTERCACHGFFFENPHSDGS
jgi:alpha-galactosidase